MSAECCFLTDALRSGGIVRGRIEERGGPPVHPLVVYFEKDGRAHNNTPSAGTFSPRRWSPRPVCSPLHCTWQGRRPGAPL